MIVTLQHALCVVEAARGSATGFAFLRPDCIVTAAHVVAGQPDGAPVRLAFAGGSTVTAAVSVRHPRVDLALLEPTAPGPDRRPLLPADALRDGEPLVCAGWPPSPDAPLSVSEVTRFERTRRQRDGYAESLIVFPAPPGGPERSGSPLLTRAGRVVAVVTDAIRLDGARYLRATSIAPLLERLAPTRLS